MKKNGALLIAIAGLLVLLTARQLPAYQNDYAQDVQIDGRPSPRATNGSSVNQYGGLPDSQIDNYIYQDDQINLDRFSGTVKILRTNQKSLINRYVTALVPLKYANPRELRNLARVICRKEGGEADVLQDKVSKQNYLVVCCPDFQMPYVMRTLTALDHDWIKEVQNGSWYAYYVGRNRDVHNILNILQFYRSPDAVWDFDDPNNAVLFFDQPDVEPLFRWGVKELDIPPTQLLLDAAVYEVDRQNDLVLGFDFASWKNSAGRDLFELIAWDFRGADGGNLFPGSGPEEAVEWGHVQTYNLNLTTAYLDFLQVKGRARLLTRSTIVTKSGTVGELAALDQEASFQSNYDTTPQNLTGGSAQPARLGELVDSANKSGKFAYSKQELAALGLEKATQQTNALLDTLQADAAAKAEVDAQLTGKATDGQLTAVELDQIFLPTSLTLQVFHNRTLRYLRSGQVGVLLSVLPYVGLQSAEVSLALDVSNEVGPSPTGPVGGPINPPIIEHRYFSSDVELHDGQPLVLAGFQRSYNIKSASGIPWLRDLKWIGYLFGREVTTKADKELVVILTPRFKLCPTSDTAPPAEYKTAVLMAQDKEMLEVPKNPFGFDQWMLDPGK